MSTCISQHGEYSEHEPNDDWSCNLCGAFDEPGVLDALKKAKTTIARVEALADCPPGDCEGHPCIWPEDIRAALAEPERDEEGGR